ncbi:MAG: zinc-binding dehydrogenase, partial [Myxococcales bacterium]|nr:zinc-binding dehydrogenase [Myxococcales bacterium]
KRDRMPGNHADGGFATHCYVPSKDVVCLDPEGQGGQGKLGAAQLEAWELAPLADAATTAYQAIVRSGLGAGDLAVFVGIGGVGGFGAQLARAEGARVVAIDVDAARLQAFAPYVDRVIDARGRDAREVRKEIRGFAKEQGLADAPLRIFETSGAPPGQQLAFTLLERGGSLAIVGFTPEKIPLRLSNIMALDADVHGNWGCDPALYSAVVDRALAGEVQVRPFIERRPLSEVNEVLEDLRAHRLSKRAVLVPEPNGGPHG